MNATTRSCIREGCSRRPTTRGMCKACYQTYWVRQTAYGRFESTYVDSGPAREHVVALRAAGLGTRRIAELAGVQRKSVSVLLNGRADRGTGPSKRIHRHTARAILSVSLPAQSWRVVADPILVDSTGTSRRMQALIANGWSVREIAKHSTIQGSTLYRVAQLDPGMHVIARVAREVDRLFSNLQLVPGTCSRSRIRGLREGWALPFQWDEDTIDDPNTAPHDDARWTPDSARRERAERVAELTAAGRSARAVAAELSMSSRTVERYRKQVSA